MFKLLRYMKKNWGFALLAPLMMIGEVGMDFLLTSYMEKMVDYGINATPIDIGVITYNGLMMLVIVLAGVAFGILAGVFTNLAAFNFSNALRKDLYKKIMELSYNQADKFSTSTLVTRVTNDVTKVQNMVSMSLRMLVRALSFFVLGIIFTLQISSRFGVLILIMLPVEVIILVIFACIIFPVFKKIQKQLDQVNTVVHENVSGARVIKAFNKEDYEYNRFKGSNDSYTDTLLWVSKLGALLMPIMMILIYGTQMIIYWIGGNTIIDFFNLGAAFDGEMIMVGEISQAVTYISMISMSIMMLGMTFMNFAQSYASSTRINEVLDCKLEIVDGNKDLKNTNQKGTICFDHVSFAYPGAKEPILSNLNFTIKQGEMVAIVGATGCGKSSLVNLLPRFYDTTEGTVYIDGYDVKDYKLFDLRNKIAMCLQKAELFKGTVKDNVRWGKMDASDEEVKQALDISQASEFVFAKEKGMDEEIEEKGTSLSGGQKQRLSIARAVIKKPEIIVFDDSTSALDLVTEAKLHAALRKNLPNMTKIVVAQRVATAKNADRIIVLENGKVVAFDSHENLMQSCPIYQDIYNSQLKSEDKIYE